MPALVGHTGPPEPALLTLLGTRLSHRGPTQLEVSGPFASLAVRRDTGGSLLDSTGVASQGSLSVAISGMLLGADWRADAPRRLLGLWRDRRAKAFASMRGAWVAAVSENDELTLARDGAGARTLYHARHAGRLIFASEPKALLAVPGFPRRIRPASVAAYLSTSFVPGDRTLLEDVRELLPGHSLTVRSTQERAWRWFRPDEAEGEREQDEEAWVEEFAEEHRRATAERVPDGAPVAVFLSGGLDSSAVAAEVKGLATGEVSTWSLHFGPNHPNELAYSRAVAARLGTRHHEVELSPASFLPRLRRIAWYLDEPVGDPITAPNFELAARVAEVTRFAFNGEGGDPVFGGPKNLPLLLSHWYGDADENRRRRAAVYLASYRRAYEEWARLLAPAWGSAVEASRDLEALFEPWLNAERPASFLHRLSLVNQVTKGAHLILPKVERMYGAAGLTPLSPLFDERLIRLSYAMPPTLKLRHGVEKVVLKRAFAERLPREVLERPKSGMRVPVHAWFEGGALLRYARRVLSSREVRRAGLLDPARVEQFLERKVEESQPRYGLRLWMLLTLELWRRVVVEGEPP